VYGVGVDLRELRERLRRTLPGKLVERFVELRPIERGLALGSKLFTAVVPAAILLSGLLTSPDAVANRLVDGLGLTGPGAAAIRQLFHAPPSESTTGVGIIGILVLLYSLLSFARTLQRLYEDAWRLPPVRTGIVWGSVWLVTFAVYFSMATPFAHLLGRHGLTVSAFVVSLIGGAVLWSVTPAILLGRRVPLRALRRGGLATAVLLTLFNVGSRVYVPHSMTANTGRYGLVGVTFTLLTWLFAFCLVLVASAAAGAVLGDTPAAESARANRPAHAPPGP
jgi:membrane protein